MPMFNSIIHMTLFNRIGYLMISLFLVSGCHTYSDSDKSAFDKNISEYLHKKGIECTKSPSGLYYKIIRQGKGETIQFQDVVSFCYKGYFLNGEVFDHVKKPVEFQVKDLIGAWKEIMLELKPGSSVYLVAPPQLGYGDRELDDIPANSILVFEMEIINVK
jgi:FKBP-type peptidyl-prolyl cis-trans isomerase FkpA